MDEIAEIIAAAGRAGVRLDPARAAAAAPLIRAMQAADRALAALGLQDDAPSGPDAA